MCMLGRALKNLNKRLLWHRIYRFGIYEIIFCACGPLIKRKSRSVWEETTHLFRTYLCFYFLGPSEACGCSTQEWFSKQGEDTKGLKPVQHPSELSQQE